MITVVIPALNESARIAGVIELALKSPGVAEVIVVDDGSVDNSPAIATAVGARVITSSLLGKGASMEDGLQAASHEIVVYLDGDLIGLRPDLIQVLVEPILAGEADFAKARFSRAAGRVTTLTARPLLQIFFPELTHFVQPLGGIIAGKASLFRSLKFETDYGVDLALLIDAHMLGARIVEVDIGHLEHDSQSLDALGEMSKQVVRALLHRADRHGRLSSNQLKEVEEVERHAHAEMNIAARALQRTHRLAVFDMDGTLLRGRFIVELAKHCGKEAELARWLDNHQVCSHERSARIAAIFEGVDKAAFEKVAREIPLAPGAVETVVALRRLGFTVGIVTDSYRIAAEIVRRRVFADFSVANLVRFRDGRASGICTISPLLSHPDGCPHHQYCKQNVVLHLRERFGLDQVLAIGDGLNDICMLRAADLSIAFEPKDEQVGLAAQFTVEGSLTAILEKLQLKGWACLPTPANESNEAKQAAASPV
jgi:glucosyl-3-phosphoglycerate synthase